MDYIAYLRKERKSSYGISFPDFPGCISAGASLEEARRNAAEALSLHIEGMLEDGEEIPAPSTLDDLAEDAGMKGAIAFLVSVNISDKVERFNITARKSEMEKIDQIAKELGMTRSAYIIASALNRAKRAAAVKRGMPGVRRASGKAR